MRIMFKVLERSIIYPLDNSNEKQEMTVEMLFKMFARDCHLYKSVMKT